MSSEKSVVSLLKLRVDRNSPVPYYAQVKEALIESIDDGRWKPGDQLPGEPELCEIFDVSRTVIRQALKDMEYHGLIVRQKGVGTFVAEPKISESLVQRLTGFYQDMVSRGHKPVTRVLRQEVVPARPKVAARLNIEQGTPVIEMERLRFIEDEPIVLVTTWLPQSLCPGVAAADFSEQSLYEFMARECGLELVRGRRTLEAVLANEYEAQLLGIELGAPLMLLESVSYLEDGTPVEYYKAVHRGDRSRFEVDLVRIRERGNKREVVGEISGDSPPSSYAGVRLKSNA